MRLNKICNNCNACKLLYYNVHCKFYTRNFYYCAVRDEIIEPDGTCENWHERVEEYDLSDQRFLHAEEDIKKNLVHYT